MKVAEKLINMKQLCPLLGLSYDQVRSLRKNTDIPRIKIGKRQVMYRPSSVLAWFVEHERRSTEQERKEVK